MMSSLKTSAAVVDRLGWVLVHSLWQFALVAVVALVLMRVLRRASSQARYVALLAVFFLLACAPAATWQWYVEPAPPAATSVVVDRTASAGFQFPSPDGLGIIASSDSSPVDDQPDFEQTHRENRSATAVSWSALERLFTPWLNTIVSIWCCGVLGFALRPVLGWFTVRRLRRIGVSPVPDALQALLAQTARRLKVRQAARILQSTLVQVPLVVGFLRPVILLPVSIIGSLPLSQLEAILAHELAHIRRLDYFVNLWQTLVETLFFYHPAVWWLSRQIRDERENCCDDLAVAVVGNRVEYGQALLSVEELRGAATALALGAAGGSLVKRIRRLLNVEPKRRRLSFSWSAGAALSSISLAVVLAVSLSVSAQSQLKSTGTLAGTSQKDAAAATPDENSRSLDIVIAQHVLLWEGKIVTWEQVVDGLRAIRKQSGKPIHPSLHFTTGAINAGLWDRYQTAAAEVKKELFDPAGMSFRWMSHCERYDALRTTADLVLRPEHIRTGTVRIGAGRPVNAATVFLLPDGAEAPTLGRRAVMLQWNMSLRDPVDEVWTQTDTEGRFRIAAPDSGYRLAVVSPAGFAVAQIPETGKQADIKLTPFAEIHVTSADKSPQTLSFVLDPPDLPDSCWGFEIHGVSIGEQSKTIRVPPGRLTVGRELDLFRGVKNVVLGEQFVLQPSEKKTLSLPPADPDIDFKLTGRLRWPSNTNPAHLSDTTMRSLYKPTTVEFIGLELVDAIQYLRDYHQIAIRVDNEALQTANILLEDKPVTLKLNGALLHWVFKLLLEPVQLGYFVDAEGIVITTREKAAADPKADVADGRQKPAATPATAPADKPEEKPRSLDIVIAGHVMIWDGEIKTWAEIIERLRTIRKQKGAPIHPNFKFTNGAIKAGLWDRYQRAAFEVYNELFEPEGMSIGSVSPRAGERYDAIRTPADLVPKPENVRTGIVRNAAGRPVTVATVLLMPEDSVNSVMLQSNMSLRDPLDEVWARTDQAGRFKIASPDTGYRLAVLSPAGFALAPIPESGKPAEIILAPHAELELTNSDKSQQELILGVHLAGLPGPNPAFSIFEITVEEQGQTLRLPPGHVNVSRMVANDKGTRRFALAETIDIKPGEKRKLAIEPPEDDQQEEEQHTLTITIVAAADGQVASLTVGLAKLFDGPLDARKLKILDRRLKDVFAIEGKPFDQVLLRAAKDLQIDELTKIIDVCKKQKLLDGTPVDKISFVELRDE